MPQVSGSALSSYFAAAARITISTARAWARSEGFVVQDWRCCKACSRARLIRNSDGYAASRMGLPLLRQMTIAALYARRAPFSRGPLPSLTRGAEHGGNPILRTARHPWLRGTGYANRPSSRSFRRVALPKPAGFRPTVPQAQEAHRVGMGRARHQVHAA